MTILVTGSTGRIGGRVLEALGEAGQAVRAAKRHPSNDGEVAFDWYQPATWPAAADGIETAFVMTPEALGNVSDPAIRFLEAAKSTGVKRIVLLSALGADEDDHGTGMTEIEAAVRSEFLDHCILRPNTFMQNFSEGAFLSSIVEQGALVAPVGDAKVSFIDLRDIAACVVSALTEHSVTGTFTLTGPEALSFSEAARHISDACGRDIHHLSPTDEEMGDILRQAGMPPPLVSMILGFYVSLRDSAHSQIAGAVEQLTKTSPRKFSAFAAESSNAWKQDV